MSTQVRAPGALRQAPPAPLFSAPPLRPPAPSPVPVEVVAVRRVALAGVRLYRADVRLGPVVVFDVGFTERHVEWPARWPDGAPLVRVDGPARAEAERRLRAEAERRRGDRGDGAARPAPSLVVGRNGPVR